MTETDTTQHEECVECETTGYNCRAHQTTQRYELRQQIYVALREQIHKDAAAHDYAYGDPQILVDQIVLYGLTSAVMAARDEELERAETKTADASRNAVELFDMAKRFQSEAYRLTGRAETAEAEVESLQAERDVQREETEREHSRAEIAEARVTYLETALNNAIKREDYLRDKLARIREDLHELDSLKASYNSLLHRAEHAERKWQRWRNQSENEVVGRIAIEDKLAEIRGLAEERIKSMQDWNHSPNCECEQREAIAETAEKFLALLDDRRARPYWNLLDG